MSTGRGEYEGNRNRFKRDGKEKRQQDRKREKGRQ